MGVTRRYQPHETISRVLKIALDDGAPSLEAVRAQMKTWAIEIHLGDEVRKSPTLQAATLSAVAIGQRCLFGGVNVVGNADYRLSVPWEGRPALRDVITALGGQVNGPALRSAPRLLIGSARPDHAVAPTLQFTFDGWSAGVLPVSRGTRLAERQEFAPSGVLGAALAVSEIFQYHRGSNPMAARRSTGISLWRPEGDWMDPTAVGPVVAKLPAKMWLLGLGHLGQAYAWTLALLPYARRGDVNLFLLDFDDVVPGNESTGLLVTKELAGRRKTRVVADWLDHRGFHTSIVERRFTGPMAVTDPEPQLALIGFDNGPSRAALDHVFKRVIDCGLGAGVQDYMGITLRTLPGSRSASERWRGLVPASTGFDPKSLPGYQQLRAEGLDECGLTLVGGVTVGVPFVGATAAALVVAEAIKCAVGAPANDLVSLHLRNPHLVDVASNARWAAEDFNPGITDVSDPVMI
jgi:hypothetical protein